MTAEEKLVRIKALLGMNDEQHVRHNLLSALIDLKRQDEIDKICVRSINRVLDQLAEIEAVLEE